MTGGPPRYVLAISLEPLDATTTLFFGHLAEGMHGGLRVVRSDQPDLDEHMSGASAVILVRALFEMEPVVWACRALGIPLYYFVDDNFMVLREQPGAWSAFVGRYSVVNVRDRLRAFTGVLLSSPALVDYFNRESLHSQLILFPPTGWPQLHLRAERYGGQAATARSPIPGIGFFGGLHLHDMFHNCVLPALRRLAGEQPVRLVVAGVTEPIAASPGLTVAVQPYDPSYANGLQSLAEAGIDVLVHPSVADLANNEYKNPHALISARAIGAVPVVSARPPYERLRDAGVALQCADTVDSWHAALASALQPEVRRQIAERLAAFCAGNFSGRESRRVIDEILEAHPAPTTSGWWRRPIVRGLFLVNKARRAVRVVGW